MHQKLDDVCSYVEAATGLEENNNLKLLSVICDTDKTDLKSIHYIHFANVLFVCSDVYLM